MRPAHPLSWHRLAPNRRPVQPGRRIDPQPQNRTPASQRRPGSPRPRATAARLLHRHPLIDPIRPPLSHYLLDQGLAQEHGHGLARARVHAPGNPTMPCYWTKTWLVSLVVGFVLAGCAASGGSGESPDEGDGATSGSGSGGSGGSGWSPTTSGRAGGTPRLQGSGVAPSGDCESNCQDFPEEPIFDTEGAGPAPDNAPQLFGAADEFSGPGVCVIEPQLSTDTLPGTLIPANWLRPRFRFEPLAGEDLWEIRLQAQREANDLVVYTKSTTWVLPKDIWEQVAKNVLDEPITVTIRGINSAEGGTPSGTQGSFAIAPVRAGGKMVYWATTSSEVEPDTSKLAGFAVGEEGVVDALTIPQVGDREILAEGGRDLRGQYTDPKGVDPGHVQCIGCHVATPDGDAVAFVDHWPWNNVLASVEEETVGQVPSYVSEGAELLLNQPWLGIPAFSPAHWNSGERTMITAYSRRNPDNDGVGFTDSWTNPRTDDQLAWFDLQTSASFSANSSQGDVAQQRNEQIADELGRSFGMLALDGETRSATAPDWSHDGVMIVYTSATHTQDGRLSGNNSEVDIHMVPYNARNGGEVRPLEGASEPDVAEYYPAFSADDMLVAFNRVATIDNEPMYYRPDAEIYVVPSGGGMPTRLIANDPPACTKETSPGVINSWAKWSPSVVSPGSGPGSGKTYYWLIFSSARYYPEQYEVPKTEYSPPDTRSSQLYMTAIVVENATSEISTYPAVYLWNQDPTTSNLTPAWDDFKIPAVPIE